MWMVVIGLYLSCCRVVRGRGRTGGRARRRTDPATAAARRAGQRRPRLRLGRRGLVRGSSASGGGGAAAPARAVVGLCLPAPRRPRAPRRARRPRDRPTARGEGSRGSGSKQDVAVVVGPGAGGANGRESRG